MASKDQGGDDALFEHVAFQAAIRSEPDDAIWPDVRPNRRSRRP
jgi:hypothetical protein